MEAGEVGEIDVEVTVEVEGIAAFRPALNSSVVRSEVSVALSVSLLLWLPEAPDTWAVLKKDRASAVEAGGVTIDQQLGYQVVSSS